MIRLKVIGSGGQILRRGAVETLIPEAIELVSQGYRVSLSDSAEPGTIVELGAERGNPRAVTTIYKTTEREAEPIWVRTALNLISRTPIKERT